ncbi:MAG: aminodeoxychorismate/anthranilate synthase component II [Bacteroidetes bacterium]|nr:aminodeoxychorismate/anthranilate synthase component II [Bacteroidota bacterium]
MRVLILDNYDSFTHNLVHLIEKVCDDAVDVYPNDGISLEAVSAYDKILLSPGPGLPSEAGILPELINIYAPHKSILGVCLGLQAIGEAFGGRLKNLDRVYHGLKTPIRITQKDVLFRNCPEAFAVGRYHSWVVDQKALPATLEITSVDEKDHIMSLRHRHFDVRGVQFHPESVLSEYGEVIIRNWLES